MVTESSENVAHTREFASMQEAFSAGAEAAVASFGRPVSGILYNQAGRRFITTSLPVRTLLAMARRDSTDRKGDPGAHRNRPLDQGHVKEIVKYLRGEPKYLLPPIMLNAARPLQTFVYGSSGPTRPCIFVLPPDEYLYVTDGQHRLEALRQAIQELPQLEEDAVGVTIVEESDIEKVHQDFYDAAQVMQLAKALLVEYDGREPVNSLTRAVTSHAKIFNGRVERIGSVGKNSLMLFTTNQVKQGVLHLIVGDWSMYGAAMQQRAEQAVGPVPQLWRSRVINFFEEFTGHNEQWLEVSDRPLESGLSTDVPGMRQSYLHFSGAGLLVLTGVGHFIVEGNPTPDGTLTPQQRDLIQGLACLDWRRTGSLWRGYLVGEQGNVQPHKNNIVLAVAKAKQQLGLDLTAKERGILERSLQPEPVSR